MHSSEPSPRRWRRRFALPALCALLALAACVGTIPTTSTHSPPSAIGDCARIGESASAQQVADATALRAATERGPVFATLEASSSPQACRVRFEPGAVEIHWRMTNGGWLRVARDSRIELYEQEVRLAVPLGEEPTAWLRRAAVAAFGEGACGIEWRAFETEQAADDPSLTEQVFRGDVCNCQARLRRDAANRVVGALLRRAC
jgi:hypothetical protein